MLLSDRFLGFFLVPSDGATWNMNYRGSHWQPAMQYKLRLGVPLPYHAEQHRRTHFLAFAQAESTRELAGDLDQEEEPEDEANDGADWEDALE